MNDNTKTHGLEQPFTSGVPHSINGVSGSFTHRTIRPGKPVNLFFKQRWVSERRGVAKLYGPGANMTVEARYDDECGNGRNSFAITATVVTPESKRRGDTEAGGCLHEEIEQVFPELAHLIRWHLFDDRDPMHYLANTVYLAGDRDHSGRRRGEPSAWREVVKFGNNPIAHHIRENIAKFLIEMQTVGFVFDVVEVPHKNSPGQNYSFGPKFTFSGLPEVWHMCPYESRSEAEAFASALRNCDPIFSRVPYLFSDGKPRELDKARLAARWPDATDEQLCLPPDELRQLLADRLPALLAEFRADISAAGFMLSANVGEVEA